MRSAFASATAETLLAELKIFAVATMTTTRTPTGARADAEPMSEPWLAPLLATFCDLAYGGHVDLAWQFLDEAWPQGLVARWAEPLDRDALAAELAEALAASPCAEALGFPG